MDGCRIRMGDVSCRFRVAQKGMWRLIRSWIWVRVRRQMCTRKEKAVDEQKVHDWFRTREWIRLLDMSKTGRPFEGLDVIKGQEGFQPSSFRTISTCPPPPHTPTPSRTNFITLSPPNPPLPPLHPKRIMLSVAPPPICLSSVKVSRQSSPRNAAESSSFPLLPET
ncbi:hypothetical protein JAAARDRAFT_661900 [Jaapia argillacea MUCL 33604]|uniref:Uncharacterized protein n=1 Tax=Jaapia argillacea MUCL 33604 TaxID=933084 RepID=A0A067PFN4_9AGAM|nr:hypothetical protein JAAARDRAFT_661900 [Jaapia argillacea MUCL 33604]